MKVVMVTSFPDEPQQIVGGVAGAAKYLVDEFARFPDTSVTVVVPQGTEDEEPVCEKWDGCVVYRLPRIGIGKFLPGTLYDMVAGRAQVRRFIHRLGPDIAHFQGASFLAANCGTRNVLTIHGIAERDAIWDMRWGAFRWFKCLLLKLTEGYGRGKSPHIIVISDYVEQFLPENKRRKIWRIDNPIEDSFFKVNRKAEPGRIFCCSTITPRKNIAGMIDVFGQIARLMPHCRLRIAGASDPAYLRACKKRVETRRLQSRVDFLGNLTVREVQRELSKADCFAMTSFQETAPLSIAEAMAAGVPVVAAAVGGIPDMVEHGRTGYLVDPYDPRDIEDAIARILSDDRLARSMGQKAAETARKRYMASVVARKTVEVYREILGAGRLQGG
jgi:glycosyltransferase involved in cell wall biosynthesis